MTFKDKAEAILEANHLNVTDRLMAIALDQLNQAHLGGIKEELEGFSSLSQANGSELRQAIDGRIAELENNHE